MKADWDVIRYLPDIRRGEARNVGVALIADGSVRIRFFAEQAPGKVDGRSVRTRVNDLQNYKEWIAYFRRKANSGKWEDVRSSRLRRPDYPYFVDYGGVIFDASADTLDTELDILYQEVVADPAKEPHPYSDEEERPDALADKIDRILQRIPISVRKDAIVPGEFSGGPRGGDPTHESIRFGFSYKNGRLHLMDSVSSPMFAYSFFARAEAAYKLDDNLSFLAFYRGEKFARHEAEIEVIERYANTVDVEDEEEATGQVAELLGVNPTMISGVDLPEVPTSSNFVQRSEIELPSIRLLEASQGDRENDSEDEH